MIVWRIVRKCISFTVVWILWAVRFCHATQSMFSLIFSINLNELNSIVGSQIRFFFTISLKCCLFKVLLNGVYEYVSSLLFTEHYLIFAKCENNYLSYNRFWFLCEEGIQLDQLNLCSLTIDVVYFAMYFQNNWK